MVAISAYSPETIKEFYDRLVSKQSLGIRLEYEIRVDHEQIIPRSTDLNDFFSFQSFILQQTQQIEIFLYKGNSNRYDKYVFEMEKIPSLETTIQSRLAEELKKIQLEWEFKRLHQELRDAKDKIKELKETSKEQKNRIKQLEGDSKNSKMLHDLMGVIKQSSLFEKQSVENGISESVLNGIPQKELLETLSQIQKELGDETFQALLGTSLMLGKHPALIPEVKRLIEKSISNSNPS